MDNDPVIEYLQQIRAMHDTHQAGRHSIEGLLLDVGRTWGDWIKDNNLLGRYNLTARELKACFRNAGTAAIDNPELTYVEGYAGTIIPIMHAWCVTDNGTIIDPTWEDGHHYFGIAFPTPWLRRHIVRTSVWGVFGGDYVAVNDILNNGLDSEVLDYNRRFAGTAA